MTANDISLKTPSGRFENLSFEAGNRALEGIFAHPAYSNRDNPYNQLLYLAMEREGVGVLEWSPVSVFSRKIQLWHTHWPEAYVQARGLRNAVARTAAFLALLLCAKARGVRIVWTVHNIVPHESANAILQRAFYWYFVRAVDGVICLSNAGKAKLYKTYPDVEEKPITVIPHGHYRDSYAPPLPRWKARELLGLPLAAPIALFFGNVRAYKNVPALIDSFKAVMMDANRCHLLVAGRPNSEAVAAHLVSQASGNPRIHLCLRHIDAGEIPALLGCCDLVVLPFAEITNSGSVMLALSFDRPVLAPRLGALPELQETVGDRWLSLYDGRLTGEILGDALRRAAQKPREGRCPLDHFDWQPIGRATLSFYKTILGLRAATLKAAPEGPEERAS